MFVWYINRAKMFKFANKPVNEFLICVNCGHFFEKKKKKKADSYQCFAKVKLLFKKLFFQLLKNFYFSNFL